MKTCLQIWVWFIIAIIIESTATDITDVRITGMIESPYAAYGVIIVKFGGALGYVCYYGDRKYWDKREATTACRQLGYAGGWPTMRNETEKSTHNLNNFDCGENLEDLNECEFYTTTNCEQSMIAGIQCYNSFKATLIDGKTPNIGRVQVKYDNVSSDVCYTDTDSNPWIFYNTQVLCRELGFPGAMFAMKGSSVDTGSTIRGYACKSDLREESLQNCYPDLPHQSSSIVSNDFDCYGVTVACAPFGYIGCFDSIRIVADTSTSFQSVNMTINLCRHYCRDRIYQYAFLTGGDECLCTSVIQSSENPVGDNRCTMRCSGDNNEVCGDEETASIYDVTKGICTILQDNTYNDRYEMVYFLGEIVTLQCKPGTKPVNQTSMQCVLDDDLSIKWNSTEFPTCIEIDQNHQKNTSECRISDDGKKQKNTPTIPLSAAVFILSPWFFMIALYGYKIWLRKCYYENQPNAKGTQNKTSKITKVPNDEQDGNNHLSSKETESIEMKQMTRPLV